MLLGWKCICFSISEKWQIQHIWHSIAFNSFDWALLRFMRLGERFCLQISSFRCLSTIEFYEFERCYLQISSSKCLRTLSFCPFRKSNDWKGGQVGQKNIGHEPWKTNTECFAMFIQLAQKYLRYSSRQWRENLTIVDSTINNVSPKD